MILLITGWFDEYNSQNQKTGRKNFLVSHEVDLETDKNIVLPNEQLREWVIE